MKRIAAVVVGVVLVCYLAACQFSARFKDVAAQNFYLIDEDDRFRGMLFARDDVAGVVITDKAGKLRILLATYDSGVTSAVLFDENGKIAKVMAVHRDGKPAKVDPTEIEENANRLMDQLRSGWLEGLREIDSQVGRN